MALRRLVAGRALGFEQECHLWHHMTYFLAHDIVSGGDGVVAVRWLLSCNLCCHFLFKCVVKRHGTEGGCRHFGYGDT